MRQHRTLQLLADELLDDPGAHREHVEVVVGHEDHVPVARGDPRDGLLAVLRVERGASREDLRRWVELPGPLHEAVDDGVMAWVTDPDSSLSVSPWPGLNPDEALRVAMRDVVIEV